MHLSAPLQLAVPADCSVREYRSSFKELSSIIILKYSPNMLALHAL